MKKIFTLIVALAMILSGSTSFAAEKLIEASGEYVLDPRLDETAASATARAREEAKRLAVEKAGVYIETYTRTINLELVEDEVQMVASRLLKVQEELPPKMEPINNNTLIKFTVTIRALVDDLSEADLQAMLRDKKSVTDATRKYKELQEKYVALRKEMDYLKRDYDIASEARKTEIKQEVARNIEDFSAVDAMSRANNFYFAQNYSQALAAYDEAIRLNPQFAEAYNNRGIVKYELGQYAAAVTDYTTAINLKPNFADALNNRGNAQLALSQFPTAEQDFKAALNLDANNAVIHNNLGTAYYSMQKYDAALGEYTRAIQLNPQFAEAYYNRGAIHYGHRRYNEALSDIKISLSLNPSDAATCALYEKIVRKVS